MLVNVTKALIPMTWIEVLMKQQSGSRQEPSCLEGGIGIIISRRKKSDQGLSHESALLLDKQQSLDDPADQL